MSASICLRCAHCALRKVPGGYAADHCVLTGVTGLSCMERCADFQSAAGSGVSRIMQPDPAQAAPDLIREECDALCTMLLEKNAKYGNSALEPVRVFSKADPVEQIRVRLDDKLSRLMRGAGTEDEDVEIDLMGYLILLRVARRMREARP